MTTASRPNRSKPRAAAAPPGRPAPAGARLELADARLMARVWASTIPGAARASHAAAFTAHSLTALCRALALPDEIVPTLRRDWMPLDAPAMALASTIGTLAAGLARADALGQITSLYPALLPAPERSARGAFYTPPALVEHLLDQATGAGMDWGTARVLDPAAGGGIFMIHAAARMIAALGDCEPVFALGHIATRLSGFELDPNAAIFAQSALEIALADLAIPAGRAAPAMITQCDTLQIAPEPVFDLVIGNPPYGRVTLSPPQRARYARSLYGHANLYGLFTDAALRWTKPGGLIAYLTPTSFLGGQYYAALRNLLATEAPPVAIDFVHNRKGVFEDVLQETLLASYRRGAPAGAMRIGALTATGGAAGAMLEARPLGTVALPADPSAPWLAPRAERHGALIAQAQGMTHRLADWGYTVSTGPLVWNRYKGQLRERSGGQMVHPLIWAESVTPDGQFAYRARKRNHAPYFRLEAADGWLLSQQPCVLVQRTTAKEQARRLIAAELPADFIATHGGVVVENHLNMVRATGPAAVATAVVAALLNSRVVDELFRCISGSIAVSAFELLALPLPAPEQTASLAGLIAQNAPREAIEAECAALYGETR